MPTFFYVRRYVNFVRVVSKNTVIHPVEVRREALIFCWLLLIGVNRADLHETRNETYSLIDWPGRLPQVRALALLQ